MRLLDRFEKFLFECDGLVDGDTPILGITFYFDLSLVANFDPFHGTGHIVDSCYFSVADTDEDVTNLQSQL